ncbi:MAG TPA: peptidoglycan editing factor PgeF [Burkholderiales bacterium]|nr:peptidoglycan editing factor PgeF [Burkholderiales bacterium]
MRDLILPDWPARVGALVTTAAMGDMASDQARARLRALLPAEPGWLHQVHGAQVVAADAVIAPPKADASYTHTRGTVCVVKIADCMPVLFADEAASVVGAAHAGWRGLASGVLEATIDAMRAPPATLYAWLGPAIGPNVYEVGEDVRAAIGEPATAFKATRPGHWLLDLYAVARARLEAKGVRRIYGGGYCTYTERERFFSYRRDRGQKRMAAAIWIA